MNGPSRQRPVLGVLLALSLIGTACEAQPSVSTTAPSDVADPNGELITNIGSEPDTIDPHKASFVSEIGVVLTVFEGLMSLDPNTLKPVPAVAANFPDVSAGAKTWKFTLRDNVKFSDGTPVTAKDFQRGFLRTCDPKVKGNYSFVLFVINGCEDWRRLDPKKATDAELTAAKAAVGIKVPDDRTIEFDLRESAAYFGSIAYMWVGMPVKQESLDKGGDSWTEPATYIGNGPFRLTEWKHGEKMVFERNELYWRGVPKLKKNTRVMINEPAVAFAAYRSNDLDYYGVGGEDLRTIETDPVLSAQLHSSAGACTTYVGFDTRRPPFDDPATRLAFAKSMDRDSYIRDVLKIGIPANGGFIPPAFPGYDKEDAAQRFDPVAAKALLAGSKYFGKPELDKIPFTYSANARSKTRIEWLQQQWRANLGVNVVADPVDPTTFTQLVKQPATKPLLFILGWCADFPHQQNWLTTVFYKGSSIQTGWKNDEFDRLVRQADQELNGSVADETYLKASRVLSADAPAAWLVYAASKFLRKPWVGGATPNALDLPLRQWEVYVTKKS